MASMTASYAAIAAVGLLWAMACACTVRACLFPQRGLTAKQAAASCACFLCAMVVCLMTASTNALASTIATVGFAAASIAALILLSRRWRTQEAARRAALEQAAALAAECESLRQDARSHESTCARAARGFDLTRREEEILTLIVCGRTYPEICTALVLSPNTVKTHARNIYRKLGVSTRDQAIDIVLGERS